MRQRDAFDCGPTCLAYLCRRLGRPHSVALLRQWAGTDRGGTTALGLVQAGERAGLVLQGIKGPAADLPSLPAPLIAHVILPSRQHHYVVIVRMGVRSARVMDPAVGRCAAWTLEKLAGLCSGVFLLATAAPDPTGGDDRRPRRDAGSWTRLWQLLRPHRPMVVQAVMGAVLATILGLAMSLYVERLIDTVLPDQDFRLLLLLGLGMAGVIVARLALGWIQTHLALRVSQRLDASLILGYHRHLLTLPRAFHEGMRVGEMMSRIGDAVKIRAFLNSTLVSLVLHPLVVAASLVGLSLYHPRIGLLAAALVLFQLLLYPVINRVNRARQRETMVRGAEWQAQLTESLGLQGTVRAMSLEPREALLTENHLVRLLRATRRLAEAGLWGGTLAQGATQIYTLATLWVGAWLVLHQQLSVGELMSAYTLAGYLSGPCAALVTLNGTVQEALVATERLYETLDLEREHNPGTVALTEATTGDVRFEGVSFCHPGRLPILRELCLTCRRGELTVLAGPSGCGKSSVLALLQAHYRPETGRVRIGEVDLTLFELDGLRRGLSVLPQRVELFTGTILENLTPEGKAPDLPRLLEACRDAGAIEWIETQPAGFGTWLQEGGANLSGGQRQRLALARAFYRPAPILLLDEPTSALDGESERQVVAALRKRAERGTTVIVAAHGNALLEAADTIVWLQEGRFRAEERRPRRLS